MEILKKVLAGTASTVFACALTACGGGGSPVATTPATPASPASPTGPAVATLAAPSNGKTAWNVQVAASVSLKDGAGVTMTGLTCTADDAAALSIAADCSSIRGLRLGPQRISVSSGAVSAKVVVTVVPQAQPFGAGATSGSNGSGATVSALLPGSALMIWGSNVESLLGQSTLFSDFEYSGLPISVKDAGATNALTGAAAASIGGLNALVLTEAGEVLSWGSNGAQLGRVATDAQAHVPGKLPGATGATALQGIVAVSQGDENALALTDDGRVYSWGTYSGQATSTATVPNLVLNSDGSDVLRNVVAISAGWNWSAALLADGTVVTWGFNSSGATGRTGVSVVNRPTLLLDRASGQPVRDVVAISAGYGFGLALTSGGQVLAWGRNDYGQLGQGSFSNDTVAGAVQVTGLESVKVKMAVAGGNHALVLTDDGKVLSWGFSQNGQLGDGANHPRVNASARPAAVASADGLEVLGGIAAIAAGYNYSMALQTDGRVLMWGAGLRGALGQGPSVGNDLHYVPLLVKDAAGTGSLSLGAIAQWPNLLRRAR